MPRKEIQKTPNNSSRSKCEENEEKVNACSCEEQYSDSKKEASCQPKSFNPYYVAQNPDEDEDEDEDDDADEDEDDDEDEDEEEEDDDDEDDNFEEEDDEEDREEESSSRKGSSNTSKYGQDQLISDKTLQPEYAYRNTPKQPKKK